MIASSTSRPSASTSAPSEILCRSMPKYFIAANVIASTSGIDSATTRPVRKPSEKKLTASTIATAIASVSTNSPTERATARGWSVTRSRSRPTGRFVLHARDRRRRDSCRAWMMSPPSRIDTAMPSAFLPIEAHARIAADRRSRASRWRRRRGGTGGRWRGSRCCGSDRPNRTRRSGAGRCGRCRSRNCPPA